MFVPTIKIKRVNEAQDAVVNSVAKLQISNDSKSITQSDRNSSPIAHEKGSNTSSSTSSSCSSSTIAAKATTTVQNESSVTNKETQQKEKPSSKVAGEAPKEDDKLTTKKTTTTEPITVSINENKNDEPTIEIDPSDEDSIIVTLTNGKKFTADRYCPHAGADLTYLGEVAEDEYPPEIGPILMCTLHYWEFLLEKEGRSANGWATLNACPVPADKCPAGENNKKLDW